ncbi:MAG: hypothetical protein Q8L89_00285 [Gammaproteobacteria bacterium]|nr:hypothetical protein [Gammaproteobacteria bacterium]
MAHTLTTPVHGQLLVGLALAVLLTAGCASTARLYPGPELAPDQIAVIEADPMIPGITARGALFGSVDGVHVSGTVLRIEVLPGAHTVEVQCSFRVKSMLFDPDYDTLTPSTRRSIVLQARAPLAVEVEAGHTYRLAGELTRERGCTPLLQDITAR